MKTIRNSLFSFLVCLFVSGMAPLWGQDSAAYVSRLTAQAGPTSVLLTWKDAEGWKGAKYEIWRGEKEIVKDSLSQAKLLATVESGVEAFEDTTVTQASYYLVLLKDSAGVRRTYYVPYRNKTQTSVKPDGAAAAATARIKLGPVAYANPQVLIPFSAYPSDRRLAVYRRSTPITSVADLKEATLLGTTAGAQSPYKDTPSPGLEFYYAIVDAQALADSKPDVFQGDNATTTPAGFPLVAVPVSTQNTSLDSALRPSLDSTRSLPLPLLQVESAPGTGAPLASTAFEPVDARPLTEEAEATLRRWAKGGAGGTLALPPPMVLPEERSATQTGAGRYLVQIQKAYMEPKDWKGATTALESVLKLELDARTRARARFYLGKAKAAQKDYRTAFLDFLAARESYPAETAPYLEALFTLLAEVKD